jgi:hypothetical protein
MDNVGIVVDDLEAAIAFFVGNWPGRGAVISELRAARVGPR